MLVMSFNVLCWRDINVRKPFVKAVLRKYMPDTFGLQEAHSMWMKYIRKGMPEYDFVGVGRENGKKLGEYSPVFYKRDKYELVDSGSFWLSETPETPSKGWDAACMRVCSYAVLKEKETGKVFAHYNTHLDHKGQTAMKNGAALVAERAAKNSDIPVILTGDFNVEDDSEAYAAVISAGFSDARKTAETTDDKCTFHAFGKRSDTIDFIFTSKQVKPVAFKTVDELVGGKYPSDHFPVAARLEF